MSIFVGNESYESTVRYALKSRITTTYLRLVSVFTLVFVLGVGNVWGDTGTLVSALNGISSGDTYYIAALNSSNYYTVPNTTISGQTFTCSEGTYNSTTKKLTPASGVGEFVLTSVPNVSNAYYIYNTNLKKYLVATGSKTFGYVDSNSSDYGYWTFSTVTSGGFSGQFSVKHSNKTHYLRAYNNSVRCYDGASNNGVYLFKKDVTSFSITASSNNNSWGTVSVSGTTITATPADCYQVASGTSGYNKISGTGTITHTENSNTISVTPTSNCSIQVIFEKKIVNTYIDEIQDNGEFEDCTTSAPSLTDKSAATTGTCAQQHYHFVGWITAANKANPTDANIIEAGETVAVNGTTYYAVWAKGTGGGSFDGEHGGSFKIYANVSGTNHYATGTGSKISSTTTASDATEYTFTKVTENNKTYFTIKTGNDYITKAQSNTDFGTSTTAYNWIVIEGTHGSWRIVSSTVDTRGFIYRASTYNVFGTYTLNGINGTEYYDLEIGGSTSYSDYITNCCEELAQINGSVSMTQTTAALEWADLDHVSSWAVQYKEHSAANWSDWDGEQATADSKRSVTINSLSCGTAYDFKIAATAASGYCDAEQVIENQSTSKWNITYDLTNTVDLSEGPAQGANACGEISATFSKNASYSFPATITVTIGGETATVNDDYLWDDNEGELVIDAAKVTGDVVIEIAGVAPLNPIVTPSPGILSFEQVKKGAAVPAAKDIAITGQNLTTDLTVTSSDPTLYAVSVKSGSLTPDNNKDASPVITVTPQAGITSTAGDKNATITISGGGLAEAVVVNVTFNVQETYTVNFYVNNTETPAVEAQTDVQGTALVVPAVDASEISDCADANYVFMGWTNTDSYTHGTSELITNTAGLAIGNADANYYAVFALKDGEDGYAELTDVADLTAGDKIVITGKNNSNYYGMKAYSGTDNNFKGTSITIASNKITDLGEACELTLGGSANAWTFYDGSKYVYSAGSSKSGGGYNNHMKGKEALGDDHACEWTIAIDGEGVTSITSNTNSATPNMQFNTSNTLFSCYNTASQSAVTLYRKISATYTDYRLVCPHAYIVDLSPATNGNGTISFAKNASAITEIETTGENDVTVDVVAAPATGYELSGVALSGIGGASYNASVITLPANTEGTLTATATFSKANYAVTYTTPSNGNYTIKVGDAAAVSTNTTAQYEQTITLAVASVTEGYQFIGWTVTKTAGGEAIAVDGNNQFTMPAEAVTVAATFQEIPTVAYTVTFSQGDHGTCTESSLEEESAGAGVTLPSCTATTGYAFLGWTATENKTTVDEGLTAGALYRPEENMTLYAVYRQLTAVTLKKGNGTTIDEVLYADATTGKVTLTSRNSKNQNYTFAGWSTKHYSTEQEDANPSILAAGEYTPSADITLYPVFSVQIPVTIWTKKTVAQVDGAGTYAIIDEDGYAFNGTISSGHGQHATNTFSFTNNVASEAPTGTCELTFTAVEGGYTLYNEDLGYLYATKAGSGGLSWHAEESSYWKINADNWQYDDNNAYLRVYDHTFRTYSGNSNNDLYFAKKENQNVTKYNAAPANDVAAPTFLPAAGAYYGAQNVTISCATNDVTIYYTDDESVPDENSTEYTTAFSVSSSKTIKAIAIDEDGYSSPVAEAAYTIYPVYNSIAAYQAANAQEAATAKVQINKESANAIVIGVTGSYSYIQDGTAAMVIKRPNSNDPWTVGSELDGNVQGTRSTYYGLPMITVDDVENVDTSEGTLPTAQAVSNLDFAGAWSSYAGNLIKVENVYFQAQATSERTVALADGAEHTGAIYDALYKMASANLPMIATACDVTGVLVARTVENVTTYYIAPTSTEDISTKGAYAQLNVNPVGGANPESAVGIAPGGQVTITPVDGFATTLGGEAITTISTVPVTAPTSITVSASRQFYTDNEQTYYYDVDNTYMSVTVTQPTNVGGSTISASPTSAQEGNTITLSYNLAAHYHFNGWNVYKTGDKNTTVDVDGNNQFEMPEYAVTVEAEIEEDAYANVLFADGGATSGAVPTDANKYYVGDEVTMPGKNTLAKSGSTFGGWSFGGNDYAENAKYTIVAVDAEIGGKNITFTAQWTPYPWGGNGKWELVTDANEITVSPATYVIFADTQESDNKACGETQNTNNRATVGVSITDGILTWTGNSPAVFTVEVGNVENTFAFFDAINNGYIYAAGTGNDNHLKTKSAKDTDNAAWAIESIDSETGETSVRAQSNNRNLLQVNGNVCAAYNAKQKGLAIYKFVAGNYYNINYAVGNVDEPEEVSNMPATQVTANDGTATLSSETPIYVGKLFQNWKDEEADQTYEPGANVTLTQNVTLTAQWTDATAHSLSYDLNGGTLKEGSAAVPEATDYYPGAEVTVTAAVLEKTDVIFIGWEYNGDIYGAGSSFTMPNEAVTLTAKFAKGAIYTVATAASVTAQGAPEGSTATFENTYTGNKEQMIGGKSMTLTLSGYKGYLIKNITLSMHANSNSGAGTFSATVGGNSIASIDEATNFNSWYDNNSYGSTYRDVHVTMTDYPAVGAYEDVEIVIAATANSLFCQSFTIEYEVSPVEINNEESVDASDILPGADVTINNGGTLVIDEEKELNDITVNSGATVTVNEQLEANNVTVKDGATVTVNEELVANDLTVEAGGEVTGSAALTINDLTIKTSLGTISGDDNDGGKSGEISNSNITANGDVFIEIELTQATQASYGWYAFSVPFPVNTMNGVYYQNTPLQNEVGYAIMAYHEDERAAGKYAWKKYRETNLVPGMLYIITVGDTDYKTLRFKKAQGTDLIANTSVPVSYTVATGGASGWNGVGNPNLQVSHQNDFTYLQFLDHDDNCFRSRTADKTDLLVGTAFMVQVAEATENITIATGANTGTGNIALAPARAPKAVENSIFEVKLRNTATGKTEDNLFLTAREDAMNAYEIGRDVTKMSMGTAKCAQMWVPAYGTKLCAADFPLVNGQAEYPLTITAPAAGSYRIEAAETYSDATIYLKKDGAIIWDLTMSPYEAEFDKGATEGYGLMLVRKAPQVTTGVENVQGDKTQCTKVILNDHVYILRDAQLYDVTGKAVK